MKSVKDLKNPDIIELNGEKYQVLDNFGVNSVWYHEDIDDMEYAVDLVKVGEKYITPTHQLRYFSKKPDVFKFYKVDNKVSEIKITKAKL